MVTITTSTLISNGTLFIRDLLLTNLTDPLSATRPASEKFVMTSYPDRAVTYPIVTVKMMNNRSSRLGLQSEQDLFQLDLEVRVWARNQKEKDQLSEQVYNVLRSNQQEASTGTITNSLFGFRVSSTSNVDEGGKAGIKSRILNVTYLFVAS